MTEIVVRGAFRCAEKLAGIEHVKGRGAYGVRRVGRDVAEGLSQSAIENFGGWTPGSSIPNAIYRETANRAGRREARGARAKLRGEIETSTQLEQLHRADETEVSTTGDRNGL